MFQSVSSHLFSLFFFFLICFFLFYWMFLNSDFFCFYWRILDPFVGFFFSKRIFISKMQFSIHPTNTKEWRSCWTIIRLKHFNTKTTLSAYSPGGERSKVNVCGLFLYLNSLNYKSLYACIRAHYLILMAVWMISMGLQCFANVSLFVFSCVCLCVCYFFPF